MFTTACCLVVWLALGLGLGLDLVPGWLVAMHTYLYHFRLTMLHCPKWPTCIGWNGKLHSLTQCTARASDPYAYLDGVVTVNQTAPPITYTIPPNTGRSFWAV